MLYVVIARATPWLRLSIAGVVAGLTVACLPPRLWASQLRRLTFICSLIFLFTALGADGVPPVLQQHSLPPGLEGMAAASASLTPEPRYSYVLFNLFGWITITRRSVNLAVTAAALTFCALQSASLCLVTTPGEEMAAALSRCVCLDSVCLGLCVWRLHSTSDAAPPHTTPLPHSAQQVAVPPQAAGRADTAHRAHAAAVAALHVPRV
jgi:energy-coupling factor transporter transmembrane protein EcfT